MNGMQVNRWSLLVCLLSLGAGFSGLNGASRVLAQDVPQNLPQSVVEQVTQDAVQDKDKKDEKKEEPKK